MSRVIGDYCTCHLWQSMILARVPGIAEELWVLDIACSTKRSVHKSYNICPCITRARGASKGFWLTSRKRWTSITEKLRLMGMLDSEFPLNVISETSVLTGILVFFDFWAPLVLPLHATQEVYVSPPGQCFGRHRRECCSHPAAHKGAWGCLDSHRPVRRRAEHRGS